MPQTPSTQHIRHFDTLVSPLEAAEQPDWLHRASPEERRQWVQHSAAGRQARRLANEAFAALQSHHAYNLLDLAAMDSASITPQVFYQVQRRQQLDERYPTYLSAMLAAPALQQAKHDAYLATLREEYSIARIKGDLDRDGKRLLDWITGAYAQSSAEFRDEGPFVGTDVAVCSALQLFGHLLVPDVLLLGPAQDDALCVAYVPGHPRHPLKQYPSRQHFFPVCSVTCWNCAFASFSRVLCRYASYPGSRRAGSRSWNMAPCP